MKMALSYPKGDEQWFLRGHHLTILVTLSSCEESFHMKAAYAPSMKRLAEIVR